MQLNKKKAVLDTFLNKQIKAILNENEVKDTLKKRLGLPETQELSQQEINKQIAKIKVKYPSNTDKYAPEDLQTMRDLVHARTMVKEDSDVMAEGNNDALETYIYQDKLHAQYGDYIGIVRLKTEMLNNKQHIFYDGIDWEDNDVPPNVQEIEDIISKGLIEFIFSKRID